MVKRKTKSPVFDRATRRASKVDRIRKPRRIKPDNSLLGGLLEDYRQDPAQAIAEYRKKQAKK